MNKHRYTRNPYQAAYGRLCTNALLVRYINAVHNVMPARTDSALVLEACVEKYAPKLFAPGRTPRRVATYAYSRVHVNDTVMAELEAFRQLRGQPLTVLIEDAVVEWMRTYVVKLVMLNNEQAVFVWDEYQLEDIHASAPSLTDAAWPC